MITIMFINNNNNIYIYSYILCSTLFNIIQHYSTLFNIIQYHSTRKFETLRVEAPDLLRRPPKRVVQVAMDAGPRHKFLCHTNLGHGIGENMVYCRGNIGNGTIFQIQNKIL